MSTDIDPTSILRQLDRILENKRFRNSRRYTAVLEYVVRQTIAGRAESLKERTLGVEVFHRPVDYDTGTDPVVRVTAGEVRKRLADFYLEPEHALDLKIELPLGSYVPEFSDPAAPGSVPQESEPAALSDDSADAVSMMIIADKMRQATPDSSNHVSSHPTASILDGPGLPAPAESRSSWRRKAVRIAALTLLISIVAVGGGLWWNTRDEMTQFWNPFLSNNTPIVVLIGHPTGPDLEGTANEDIYANQHMVRNQVFLSDAITMSRIANALGKHPFRVESAQEAPVPALMKTPLILVGAFNNPWTMRLLQPLRFSLVAVGDAATPPRPILEIVDRRSQGAARWVVDVRQPIGKMTHDYSIIARFHDDSTESWVMVIAGLGSTGTESAGEFISSGSYMKLLASLAPRDWTHKNMEAVIDTEIIDGEPGHPKIAAAEFW